VIIFVAFVIKVLLSFVKFQVKSINFDDMSESSAVVLDFF